MKVRNISTQFIAGFLGGTVLILSGCGTPKEAPQSGPPPLADLVLSAPLSNAVVNNLDVLSINGTCLDGLTVNLSGDAAETQICESGSFSFSVSKTSDGVYGFSLYQSDLTTAESSQSITVLWTRDTVAPAAPVITAPSADPELSNTSNLLIQGDCEAGASLTLTGDATLTTSCNATNRFGFNVPKSADGVFNFSVTQTDQAGNSSASDTLSWNRDTIAPGAPVVLAPASSPLVTTSSPQALSGTCEDGSAVVLAGDMSETQPCLSGAFSFSLAESADGTYNYELRSVDTHGNLSAAVSQQWVLDSTPPSAPTITSPSPNPYMSNTNSVTISGGCETGATVYLTGDSADSILCSSSTYSFIVNSAADGSFSYSLNQVDPLGQSSASTTFQWTRDTVAPAAPIIASPASNPYASEEASFTLSGSCENGSIIQLSGEQTGSVTCSASAFSFTISKSTEGSFSYGIKALDLATNESSSVAVLWDRYTTPAAPVLTSPSPNPWISNTDSVVLAGSCQTGNTVSLSGDVLAGEVLSPAGSLTTVCASSSFSFTVGKTSDGVFSFGLVQTNAGNLTSASVAAEWTRDTVIPTVPVISSPASNPYNSTESSYTLSGSCENASTVQLSGDQTGSVTCAGSTFSFTISSAVDGTFNYSLKAVDAAANESSLAAFQWIRSAIPPAPVLSSPSPNPMISNLNSVIIAGSCQTGNSVTLSGDVVAGDVSDPLNSLTMVCSSNAFSFTVNKLTDSTYNFSVIQTNTSNVDSLPVTAQWTRDTLAPSVPLITSPAVNPYTSDESNFSLSGTCESGATVHLSGDQAETQVCTGGAFSFTISKGVDGTYNFSLKAVDLATNESASVGFQWIRYTPQGVPPTPILSSPTPNPYLSSTDTVVISGTCISGNTVTLSGDLVAGDVTSPVSALTQICISSSFAYTVQKLVDGTYNFSVIQSNSDPADSVAATAQWTRDTVAPTAPVISSPAANPYNSDESSFTLSGSCETGSTVALSGDQAGSVVCASAAFSFTITKSVDGTYNYSLKASDGAANESSPVAFQWVRYTPQGPPPAPVLSSPTPNPYLSNTNSVVISGSCITGNSVDISGDLVGGEVLSPAGSLTTSCVASSFSFTVQKLVDGVYNFSITQTNADPATSPAATAQWTRDTVAPAAPTITSPATSPYTSAGDLTVEGTCEEGATVYLSGDDTQTTTCLGGVFTFTLVESTTGSYTYDFDQVDVAGNASLATTQQWTKDNAVVPDPTMTSPASAPYLSNNPSLTISGSCNSGYTVTLSGVLPAEVTSPTGSLTQTCSANAYAFSVTRLTDGSQSIGVMQSLGGVNSNVISKIWILDQTTPETTIDSGPLAMNYTYGDVVISFSSNEGGATFECSLNGGAFSACTSPHSISTPANGAYDFEVRAKDLVNTDATPATVSWTQEAHQTVALYKLDSSNTFLDFSNYTGAQNSPLTNNGGSADTSGKYGQAQSFSGGNSATAMDNIAQDTLNSVATIEFWFKPSALPGNNAFMSLLSKAGAAGNLGWALAMKKQGGGSNYKLEFNGSQNGSATVTILGSGTFTPVVGVWAHYAVTFNRGAVTLFQNGVSVGTGSIGTAGSASLFSSTADLKVGGTNSMGSTAISAAGSFDEVRLSQVIRYTGAFTPPSAPFTAD